MWLLAFQKKKKSFTGYTTCIHKGVDTTVTQSFHILLWDRDIHFFAVNHWSIFTQNLKYNLQKVFTNAEFIFPRFPCLHEILSYLEISLDKELVADCLIVTHTKLVKLSLVAMVIFGIYRVGAPLLQKSLCFV